MTFLAGARLWLFAGLVAFALAYVARQLRSKRYAVRFTNLALLDAVAPNRPGWWRHAPAATMLLACASLLVAFARPARATTIPVRASTVVMAIDVSASMGATDVAPNRLRAAQTAADGFVERLPPSFAVGLVAFDDTPSVLVAPTTDHFLVTNAIGQLATRGGTAIGEAIFAALHSLGLPDQPSGAPPVPARIVLMSDGATNAGRPNDAAAGAAASAHVPVTTIAYGTDDGVATLADRPVEVPVDKPALQQIAGETGGGYFEAASAGQLGQVYDTIRASVSHRIREREVSGWFVGAALVLLALTGAAWLTWSPHLP